MVIQPTPQRPLQNRRLKTLTGVGMVLTTGVKAAKVSYELLMGETLGETSGHGTLRARHSTLERMWLQPQVALLLANGRRIEISITELRGVTALFQIIGEL